LVSTKKGRRKGSTTRQKGLTFGAFMVAHSPVGAQASHEFPISAVGAPSIGSLALDAQLGPPTRVPSQLKTLFKSDAVPVGAPLRIDRQ
jgi:hypothetical protein